MTILLATLCALIFIATFGLAMTLHLRAMGRSFRRATEQSDREWAELCRRRAEAAALEASIAPTAASMYAGSELW